MLLSQLFDPPLSDIVFHAETVQRWFLLALLIGRATLAGGHWSGAGTTFGEKGVLDCKVCAEQLACLCLQHVFQFNSKACLQAAFYTHKRNQAHKCNC